MRITIFELTRSIAAVYLYSAVSRRSSRFFETSNVGATPARAAEIRRRVCEEFQNNCVGITDDELNQENEIGMC